MNRAFRHFERLDRCPLCRGALEDAFPPDVVRCTICRAYVRSPRPTADEIARFYNSGESYRHWKDEREIRERLWQCRMNLLLRHERPGRILDIGTGDGHFMELCRRAGFSVDGVELSPFAAALCRERGFDPRVGAAPALDWEGHCYDVVTLWHVLEHLPDPGEVLETARNLLRPGGLLAVAVPNEDCRLFPHRLGRRSKHPLGEIRWGDEIHIVHFQPGTLREALRRRGFSVVEFGVDQVETHPRWWTRPALWGNRILNRLSGWHLSTAMYALARTPSR